MAFKSQPKGFATKAIHSGQSPEQCTSMCVIPPIVTSTTFKQDSTTENRVDVIAAHKRNRPLQVKDLNTRAVETRNGLEKWLASLDNAKYGLTFSSGLGANTAILTMLSNGDHVIISDDVYGGTNRLFRQVAARLGLGITFVNPTDFNAVSAAMKRNTKLLWIETPTNPLIKVVDIAAISKLAHDRNEDIIVAVDNTFLTSYFQRPLELGADMVVYSLTKYMNGHGDVVMGAVTLNNDNLHNRLRFLQNATGIVPAPFDCYQLNLSLKTLALRMEKHQKNALAVAKFLELHPLVEKVLHPALPSHPQHVLALKQTYGYSGVFSFYLKGELEQSKTYLKSLKMFILAESLGGYESLAELPSMMTHASVPADQREKLGITDSLIRISVGLEDSDDLIEDLRQTLKATSTA